jgi:molybdopterin converting factor subunit 1
MNDRLEHINSISWKVNNMNVRVLFFATMREKAGIKETRLDLPDGMNVADFKAVLVDHFPGLVAGMPSALVAVNHEFAFDELLISDGAEIALFPPVSGG